MNFEELENIEKEVLKVKIRQKIEFNKKHKDLSVVLLIFQYIFQYHPVEYWSYWIEFKRYRKHQYLIINFHELPYKIFIGASLIELYLENSYGRKPNIFSVNSISLSEDRKRLLDRPNVDSDTIVKIIEQCMNEKCCSQCPNILQEFINQFIEDNEF